MYMVSVMIGRSGLVYMVSVMIGRSALLSGLLIGWSHVTLYMRPPYQETTQ